MFEANSVPETVSEAQVELVQLITEAELKNWVVDSTASATEAYGNIDITQGIDCVCFTNGMFVFDEARRGDIETWMAVSKRFADVTNRQVWKSIKCASNSVIRRSITTAKRLAELEKRESQLKDSGSEVSEVVQELYKIISKCYEAKASDIHVSIIGEDALFYSRINGLINPTPFHRKRSDVMRMIAAAIGDAGVENSTGEFHASANGDTKLPNVRVQRDGKTFLVDVRIQYRSLTDKKDGPKVVAIRILNTGKPMTLPELGVSDVTQNVLASVMSEGNGMALVTGPTGAGKSTVLMAMLEAKPKGAVAHTIEDPIETLSTDPLVFQGNKKEGSYGDEVRDLMRMDPDIGQAGEIRDLKSLSEATGFARTGHLVLASLHAVSAIDAFSRMHDMGMSYNQLSEKNLFRLVSCQRLVPVLCPKCSKKVKSYDESLAMKRSVFRKQWEEWEKVATKESLERLKALAAESNLRVWNEKGCRHCHYTGIDGRQLLLEYVIIDKFARKCIREERWDEWRDSLQSRGWKSIQDQAWAFIESGSFCPNIANSKVSDLIINTDIERQYT